MALTDNSVLFHFDASAGGGRPSVGKLLTYERASGGHQLKADGRFTQLLRDTPRLHTLQANDGDVHTVLALERGASQLAAQPFVLSSSVWLAASGISKTIRPTPIFQGAGWGTILADDGSSNNQTVFQEAGTIISSSNLDYQVFTAVVEIVAPSFFSLGIQAVGHGFIVRTRWHISADEEVTENTSQSPNGVWPVNQLAHLGRGPNGGLLLMLSVMARGDVRAKGAPRRVHIYPSGHGIGEAQAPIVYYAGLAALSDVPTPFWDTIARDDWKATGFNYQSHIGYLSWVNTATSEFQQQYVTTPTLLYLGGNGGSDYHVAIVAQSSLTTYRIVLRQQHPSFAAATVNFLCPAKIGDFIEVIWGYDVEAGHFVIRGYINGSFVGMATNSIHTDMSSWGDNVVTLASHPNFTSSPTNFAPSQVTMLKLADAIPDHEQLGAGQLGEEAAEVFDSLDILHTGTLY